MNIKGIALELFRSDLADWTFCGRLGDYKYSSTPFQGSVWLFSWTQIFVLLKKTEAYSARLLLKCLENIKAWMALNFLNFNEKKSEVMVFGDNTQTPFVNLGSFVQYVESTVTNLGDGGA